ncbi:MAG: TetR/AcrR family transcriptional regulator [Solirubrobacterales bacterium]|nr:TetR/AcrR family transcriptional regulator [Solirubrobacterales bacterium]MBV8945540.1 TetR/AcrR family transcriptional regulator [Solirubrobacterales bacterium]MBV9366836.1 TetR/AcrR family transcriptional regulator [Solirubrobacterales bacterium]
MLRNSASDVPRRRGRPPAGGREAILAAALELLRERGIARVTAREVAALAGVSEASVFYHYKDRAGLLRAVFEQGLQPLKELAESVARAGPDLHQVLVRYAITLEQFLDQALPVMAAAQSDVALRDAMAEYMTEQDLGPHRGVAALGDFLAAEQAAGRVRAEVDPHATAMLFVGACYTRAAQRQMPAHVAELPSLEEVIDAFEALLAPA